MVTSNSQKCSALVIHVFTNVTEVANCVKIIMLELGPLYSDLKDSTRANSPYYVGDIKVFVQYLLNLCHLNDHYKNGNYKHNHGPYKNVCLYKYFFYFFFAKRVHCLACTNSEDVFPGKLIIGSTSCIYMTLF